MYTQNKNINNLPVDPGPCGWSKILNIGSNPVILEKKINADWVIIGAGWAGLSAARRLSQIVKGDKIVVLEAKQVGEGPSGRSV